MKLMSFRKRLLLRFSGFSGIGGATDDAGKAWRKDKIVALEGQTDKALVRSFSKQSQNIKWAGNALTIYLMVFSQPGTWEQSLFCRKRGRLIAGCQRDAPTDRG